MTQHNILKNIHNLLAAVFSDEEIRCLCYDTSAFRSVYNRLTKDSTKTDVIDSLLEQAAQKSQLASILEMAKKRNLIAYEKYGPYYHLDHHFPRSDHLEETEKQIEILIVEDDLDWQDIYGRVLRQTDYQISTARTIEKALEMLAKLAFDIVITDLKMLGGSEEFSGFGVLEQARNLNPEVQVIVITGYGSASHAIEAMGKGAYDYITKDRDLRKKLLMSVQSALEIRSLKEELLDKKSINDFESTSDRIIGNSKSMQPVFEGIADAIERDNNIFLQGEMGTGKRLIAQTIHLKSKRRDGPFLAVDCAYFSEVALEVELFGLEINGLYGSEDAQPGKLEQANNGTLFLDNIGDLHIDLQKRLLTTLRNYTVRRVGGWRAIPVDICIIASTDKDLDTLAKVGTFLEDLYYKIACFHIAVPPLRERRDGDDILALAAMFLQRHSTERNLFFSTEVIDLLRHYFYPGNVGELEYIVKHCLKAATEAEILPEHLPIEVRNQQKYRQGTKNLATDLQFDLLHHGHRDKKTEIMRFYLSQRVFINIPTDPNYASFEQVIRQILEGYDLVPIIPKDPPETGDSFYQIYQLIRTCKYAITDITTTDPSVHYKLALLQTTSMPLLLLKEQPQNYIIEQGCLIIGYIDTQSLADRLSHWIERYVPEATS